MAVLFIRGIALGGFLVSSVSADTWNMPETRKYFSTNKRFQLTVQPKPIMDQLRYWADKDTNKPNPGAPVRSLINTAYATLSEKHWWGYKSISKFSLRNEVSPVSALVSNDGTRIVTFDDWHSAGYGPYAVVIYNSKGELIRNLELKDFLSPGDIAALHKSVSSIWWGGDHTIDQAKYLLILKIAFSRENRSEPISYIDLGINLRTGDPVEPMTDRISKGECIFTVVVTDNIQSDGINNEPDLWVHSKKQPALLSEIHHPIEPSLAISQGKDLVLPKYPPLAKMARLTGRVVLELRISPQGDVINLRPVSGRVQFRQSALQAAITWQFMATPASDGDRTTYLAIDYGESYIPYSAK